MRPHFSKEISYKLITTIQRYSFFSLSRIDLYANSSNSGYVTYIYCSLNLRLCGKALAIIKRVTTNFSSKLKKIEVTFSFKL